MLDGKKTLIFAFLLIVAGVLEQQWHLLQPYLSPQTYGIGLVLIGMVVAILRAVTTTSIWTGPSDPKPKGSP